ncbi:MAG TPA: dipeptide epimerase [Bacteroidales bacterium]|nr:dipeptide epimerase [Bacteroidales bacterium]
MINSRRNFLKSIGLMAGAASLQSFDYEKLKNQPFPVSKDPVLKLQFQPYELQLKHVFTLAAGSRKTTPVMLTTVSWNGIQGFGEASMPPYLGESHATATEFLSKVDLSRFRSPFLMEDILEYVDGLAPGNHAAKASVDIALHDLTGKLMSQPWHRIWGLNPLHAPDTSYTIGIDNPEMVANKTREASAFNILKVKLGGGNDREMIHAVRSVTDVPLGVDVNQGWKVKEEALEMIQWLAGQNVIYVEQPMPKTMPDDIAWITAQSPIPVIADEAVQVPADVPKMAGVYNGINVKLMKCGGLRAAFTMISMARACGLKVMIGCMTETSCAVSAASQLSPLADWADLDGNLLISNDPYKGILIKKGKIVIPGDAGIGIEKV